MRLEELLFRYRARNFPHTLDESEQQRWQEHRAARLLEGADGARSVQQLSDEIDNMHENADERGEAILGELYDYAETILQDLN
jgi:exodeoxyribonuclease-1